MKPSVIKLLPLAALFALGVFMLSVGSGREAVHADVTSVTAADTTVNSGDSTEVEIVAEETSSNVTVSVIGLATGTTATLRILDCGTGCSDEDETGSTVTVNDDDFASPITVRLTLECTQDDTVTVGASQNNADASDQVQCLAGDLTETPTPTKTSTPSANTPTPQPTTTGSATGLSLVATPNNVSCSNLSIVAAKLTGQGGSPVSGVLITFSASRGTITSSTTTDSNGNATASFVAPSTSGAATITASGGSQTQTTTINVNCTAAPAATTAAPPPAATSTIRAPSTGDAGLARDDGWRTYVGIALVVGSLLGAVAVVRARA
jgi:hypothetical protein